MADKRGIIAFAFGVPSTTLPNRRIGAIASAKAYTLCAPVFTQRDVPIWEEVSTEYVAEIPGEPPPTLRIARAAVEWAQTRGIGTLWVAAAHNTGGSHLNRCLRDLRYAVRETGHRMTVRVCEDIFPYPRREWFSKSSIQPRTQSLGSWWSRELLARLLPMWLYKRVAS